jgi:Fe-S cluster assembly protein SufD
MIEQQYINLFERYYEEINQHSAPVLNRLRDKAFSDFKRLGFPSSKMEAYRHSDVKKSFEPDYGLNINNIQIPLNPYDAFHCDVPNLSSHLYFMENDWFYDRQLPKASIPEGVLLGSLKTFAQSHPDLLARYYGKLAETSVDGLTAFNTAFAQDGFFLYVPKNVVWEHSVQLVNLLRSNVDFLANRRVLIVLEDNAQAKLLLCDHTMDDCRFLATQIVEIFVGENAVFDFYDLEANHEKTMRINSVYISQSKNSNVLLNGITLNGGLSRNNYFVELQGEHAEAHVYGMAIADEKQHVDNFSFIHHAVPECTSNEQFKYVLDNEATGVFCGKILVQQNAQKTQAYQVNKNLCLTRQASMHSKPQLEIYADDVKCSHGATVGQLNDAALFYLQSRGISAKEARTLLMFAFVADIINNVRLPELKDRLHLLVDKRLRGEIYKCKGCASARTI